MFVISFVRSSVDTVTTDRTHTNESGKCMRTNTDMRRTTCMPQLFEIFFFYFSLALTQSIENRPRFHQILLCSVIFRSSQEPKDKSNCTVDVYRNFVTNRHQHEQSTQHEAYSKLLASNQSKYNQMECFRLFFSPFFCSFEFSCVFVRKINIFFVCRH